MNDMPRPDSAVAAAPPLDAAPFPDSVEALRQWLRMHEGAATVTEIENTNLPATHPLLNASRPVTAVRDDAFQLDGCGWEAFSVGSRYRFDATNRTVTLQFGEEPGEGRVVMRLESTGADGMPRTSVH